MASPASPPGVAFPASPDGRVSTTATAKLVWAAAARGVDEELATAIEAETDWRHKYPQVRVACSGKSE